MASLRNLLYIFVLFVVCLFSKVSSDVKGITKYNIKWYPDNSKFLIVFITSKSCTRCRNVYKYFVAASQAFEGDKEIYFGKTSDLTLMKKWDVEELPAIVYFAMGVSEPERLEGDVTVDNIIDNIAFVMKGDFTDVRKTYHVEVDEDSFDELIMRPNQHAFVLIYDQYHEEQRQTIMEVAKSFSEDDDIVIAALDADENKAFRNKKFDFPGAPLLFWFPIDDKSKSKRFGGDLTTEVIRGFINEQTNAWRGKDGTLMIRAGRFESLDKIITENIGKIARVDDNGLEAVIDEVSKGVDKLYSNEKEFGQFYIYLLQQIKLQKTTEALRSETAVIYTELKSMDLLSRKRDDLIRKHHILDFFITKIGDFFIQNPEAAKNMGKAKESTRASTPEHHEL